MPASRLTRKHYVLIADAMHAALGMVRDVTGVMPRGECVEIVAQYVASALARDNPRFDRARFLARVRGDAAPKARHKRPSVPVSPAAVECAARKALAETLTDIVRPVDLSHIKLFDRPKRG